MSARRALPLLIAMVLSAMSGCASQLLSIAHHQPSGEETSESSPVLRPVLENSTAVAQLESGQYCQLLIETSSTPEHPPDAVTVIAGRVISVDANNLVLTDCISIDPRLSPMHQRSTFSKVPYVNRLFKRTGVDVSPLPIPGELHVVRTSIMSASSIPASAWPSVREHSVARIGIDFDFPE